MATFTHTITWATSVDGRTVTYTYSYDVEDVINVQRIGAQDEDLQTVAIAQPPVLIAALFSSDVNPSSLELVENIGPSSVQPGVFEEGDLFVAHLSDAGGTWNSTGSSATTTLQPLQAISIGSIASSFPVGFELLILHQAAS